MAATAVFEASKDGDVALLRQILEESTAGDLCIESTGFSPLHIAIMGGHLACVKLLLEKGIYTDVTDNEGHCALHDAALWGEVDCARALLDAGARCNAESLSGATPLHFAVVSGSVDCLKLLLERGADVDQRDDAGRTALHAAVCEAVGNAEMVRVLIASGARTDVADAAGATPLHFAASEGHLECVRELLRLGGAGSDAVNIADESGATPLHWAAQNNRVDCAKLLIESGADKDDQCNAACWSPLHGAVMAGAGYADVVKVLLDGGAQTDLTDTEGATPLHYAAMGGHADCLKALLDGSAAVDAVDDDGMTALHRCIEGQHTECARILLDYGADINARNKDRETPLEVAKRSNVRGTAALLIALGATVPPSAAAFCRSLFSDAVSIARARVEAISPSSVDAAVSRFESALLLAVSASSPPSSPATPCPRTPGSGPRTSAVPSNDPSAVLREFERSSHPPGRGPQAPPKELPSLIEALARASVLRRWAGHALADGGACTMSLLHLAAVPAPRPRVSKANNADHGSGGGQGCSPAVAAAASTGTGAATEGIRAAKLGKEAYAAVRCIGRLAKIAGIERGAQEEEAAAMGAVAAAREACAVALMNVLQLQASAAVAGGHGRF